MVENDKYIWSFNKVKKFLLYVAIKINMIDCWDELFQCSSENKEKIDDLGIIEHGRCEHGSFKCHGICGILGSTDQATFKLSITYV